MGKFSSKYVLIRILLEKSFPAVVNELSSDINEIEVVTSVCLWFVCTDKLLFGAVEESTSTSGGLILSVMSNWSANEMEKSKSLKMLQLGRHISVHKNTNLVSSV